MKVKTGWRAIIYDAPWAYFKRGQSGVTVSEDGKSCETIDDDRSNIKVIADKNDTFSPRSNGHILFRQKGSDLFDIVCLYQDASQHHYTLAVDNVTLDGCGATWIDFKNSLNVYWLEDGLNKTPCASYDIISPTPQDSFNVDTGITYTIKVKSNIGGNEYEATATCKVNSSEETIEVFDKTMFDLSSLSASLVSRGQATCAITGDTNINGCNDKTLTFGIKKDYGNSKYKLNRDGVSATNYYNIVQCSNIINTTTKSGILEYKIISPNNIEIDNDGSFKVSNTITKVTVQVTEVTNNKTETKEITLPNI